MDGIMDNDYRFTKGINRNLIRKMEILTNLFLPALFNPFFLKPGFWEYGRIVSKRFQSVIETIFLAFHGIKTQGMPMSQYGSIIERFYGLMYTFFNKNSHASG